MDESQLKALFHQLADNEQTRPPFDVKLAHQRGRIRLRWRRARLAGTSMLAVAAIAGLAVGVGPLQAGQHRPTSRAHQTSHLFKPLDPYLSFGWLPEREKLVAGDVLPQAVSLLAGHTGWDPSKWYMQAAAAGQCHVRAQVLTCSRSVVMAPSLKLSSRAPDVQGHRAYWNNFTLIWQWAPDAWATLILPSVKPSQQQRRDAVKIANNVRYGAPTPPLLFAIQLSHLPPRWRIGSAYYQVTAGQLRVTRFSLATRSTRPAQLPAAGLEPQANLPWFINVFAAGPPGRHKFCHLHKAVTINGYRILTGPARKALCSNNAGGVAFDMNVQGSRLQLSPVQIFRSHLRLLGNNPQNWTTEPIR